MGRDGKEADLSPWARQDCKGTKTKKAPFAVKARWIPYISRRRLMFFSSGFRQISPKLPIRFYSRERLSEAGDRAIQAD